MMSRGMAPFTAVSFELMGGEDERDRGSTTRRVILLYNEMIDFNSSYEEDEITSSQPLKNGADWTKLTNVLWFLTMEYLTYKEETVMKGACSSFNNIFSSRWAGFTWMLAKELGYGVEIVDRWLKADSHYTRKEFRKHLTMTVGLNHEVTRYEESLITISHDEEDWSEETRRSTKRRRQESED